MNCPVHSPNTDPAKSGAMSWTLTARPPWWKARKATAPDMQNSAVEYSTACVSRIRKRPAPQNDTDCTNATRRSKAIYAINKEEKGALKIIINK